ncbi:hypothetical protein ESCNG_10025 [Neisseria gonorrhoeae]|uniref:Uncharacterized protein n=1 Tax=Neisseria gonorrhoeae TaxID=485 RepID=A0AB74EP99_NEIGO|nr:hypothetical protein ESCNG_10025 [Neisseria gonorrhoeae]SCW07932.1 hypothetical protein ESCNG_10226 [Neisseria gonorrhoeae]SCW07968.1 hypothetical protein ESCNG_10252 [Neisseria gonorrhoeae]SCW08146.1 hypothetical protein ESCNG_10219 [Neisseria gonorrhoeae]SCW09979.1 hypothetical protein ESCNG_130004 [Neisseria gonorrhoeae]
MFILLFLLFDAVGSFAAVGKGYV